MLVCEFCLLFDDVFVQIFYPVLYLAGHFFVLEFLHCGEQSFFFLFLDTYLADTLLWTVTCLLIQYCCQVFKKYLAVLLAKKVFLILINVSSMGSDCSVVFETLLPCVWDMLDFLLSFGYFMIHFGKIKSSLRVISWFMCTRPFVLLSLLEWPFLEGII